MSVFYREKKIRFNHLSSKDLGNGTGIAITSEENDLFFFVTNHNLYWYCSLLFFSGSSFLYAIACFSVCFLFQQAKLVKTKSCFKCIESFINIYYGVEYGDTVIVLEQS